MKDAVACLIRRVKYRGQSTGFQILGEMMAAALHDSPHVSSGIELVPVPLHRTRLRERGFNQAELLSRVVGRLGGHPVRTDLLLRCEWRGSQTTLDAEERRRSVRGAFRLRHPPPTDRRLVVVDDVWTTGATAEACRQLLLDGGAAGPVLILVAAVTPRRLPD
jgi:ComF family protein